MPGRHCPSPGSSSYKPLPPCGSAQILLCLLWWDSDTRFMCLGGAGICFSELNVAEHPLFAFMLDNKFLMASRRKLYICILKRFICHCSGYIQICMNCLQIGHANFSFLDFITSPNCIRIPAWLLNYMKRVTPL